MKKKNILVLTAVTCAVIGTGTILFNVAAEAAMEDRMGQMEMVSTSYQISDSLAAPLSKQETKEEGNTEVNYHVIADSLYKETPGETDLTMEEAAAAGMRHLRNIFGLDLEGAYVYMGYNPGTVTFPRAFWAGDVLFEKERTPESTRWTFLIDAVTGELFVSGSGRQLEVSVSLGYDAALEKDYSVYAELAKKKAEECKLMNGPIDRVEYNCQGYSGNDPDITVNVIGENGEMISMSFSRYDQAFLGLTTDTARRISDAALENLSSGVETETMTVEFAQ